MTRVSSRALTLAFALTALSACGSSPAGPSDPVVLRLAGNYQITKTGLEDTCGGPLTPVTVAGAVAHAPGAMTLSFTDGFSGFTATIQPGARFTTATLSTAPHQGAPVVTSFEQGQFTTDGFDVRVRLDINGPAGTPPFPVCHVIQAWHGVKQGSPNVIV